MTELKPVFDLIRSIEHEEADNEKRMADAQAGIEALHVKMDSLSKQLADLDKVTAAERLEALIKGKGNTSSTDASSKKAQQKAALNEHAAEIRRDISLLNDEVSRCRSKGSELLQQRNNLHFKVLSAIHDRQCDLYIERVKALVVESIVPLAAITRELQSFTSSHLKNKFSGASTRGELLLQYVEISIPSDRDGSYEKLMGRVGGPGLGLVSPDARKRFDSDRYAEIAKAMVALAAEEAAIETEATPSGRDEE